MGDEMRFSDEKLNSFYQEFKDHVENESKLIDCILKGQEENTKALEQTASAVKEMARDTHDMIEAWKGAQSVVRMGSFLGQFVKWLTSLAVIGVAVKWVLDNVG